MTEWPEISDIDDILTTIGALLLEGGYDDVVDLGEQTLSKLEWWQRQIRHAMTSRMED